VLVLVSSWQLGGGCEELEHGEALPVVAVGRSDDVMEPSGDELDVDVEAAAAAGRPAGGKELEWDDSTLSF